MIRHVGNAHVTIRVCDGLTATSRNFARPPVYLRISCELAPLSFAQLLLLRLVAFSFLRFPLVVGISPFPFAFSRNHVITWGHYVLFTYILIHLRTSHPQTHTSKSAPAAL